MAVSLVVFVVERKLVGIVRSSYRVFRFSPSKLKYNFKTIYLSSLIGGVSHVFFDMWTHRVSSHLLYPFVVFDAANPFWAYEYEVAVYISVTLLSLYSIYFWIKQMRTHRT